MNDEPAKAPPPPPTSSVEFITGPLEVLTEEDGEVDTTVRPDPWYGEQREKYGKAYELLRDAAALARQRQQNPMEHLLPASSPPPAPRSASLKRETAETRIELALHLDGAGQADVATGVGFFDHMLTLLARHSLIDLTVKAAGDLHVDAHHTVEDVGLCFGKALAQALGDKAGVRRYGDATLPMDEVLVTAAIDLSGRPCCVWKAGIPPEMLGSFNAPLAEEFWRAVSSAGAFTLHVVCHHGGNTHHLVEAIFKAAARALRQAVEPDPRMTGVPSTKGVL